jgi:hypothetical protein
MLVVESNEGMMSSGHGKKTPWRDLTVPGIFVVVAALIAAGVALYVGLHKTPEAKAPTPPTASSSPTTAAQLPPTQSTNTPPGDAPNPAAVHYLSDLHTASNHYGVQTGSADIANHEYPHSIWLAVGGCSTGSREVEYDIDPSANNFTAWIGLNKKSSTGFKLYFQVYLDDLPYRSGYTEQMFAPAEKITVPVSGKQRIKLTARWVSGGICNVADSIGYAT